MRKYMIILIVLLALIMTGCMGEPQAGVENKDEYSSMVGYVMDIDSGGRILVVDSVAQDFSDTGGVDEFYNAIFFSNAPKEITLGHKVEVWFDAVAESYPGQSEVKDIKVIQEEKPEGADLNPAEALNRLLEDEDVNRFTVVKEMEYDREQDQWIIQLKELMTEDPKIMEYRVGDQ